MEKKRNRRVFDQQFKQDAVDLIVNHGRSVASVARDLGIDQNTLHLWKKTLAPETGASNAADATNESAELRKVRRALAVAEEERDILKKALAVFSRRPQ
jgi:transposase